MEEQIPLGQQLTGWKPNGYASQEVADIKADYAKIIDKMDALRTKSDNPQVKRMASVAITEAETASMWAVKALTWESN